MEVDFARVDDVRRAVATAWRDRHGTGLSYLPVVALSVCDALRAHPRLNASFDVDDLVVHARVNLGIAVDLDFEGLVVPVIPDAGSLRLAGLADAVADLSARARARTLEARDTAGGTFTITNAGGYGTFLTGPIINPPQVAILSTDGVAPRPVAVRDGDGHAIAVHPVGNLALSFDHRAVDGAYASSFLRDVRRRLEERDWIEDVGEWAVRPNASAANATTPRAAEQEATST
jgi:2-oxoglutarate dehydrogenase E2 component (dihydrolipoamide succinyltransferase)